MVQDFLDLVFLFGVVSYPCQLRLTSDLLHLRSSSPPDLLRLLYPLFPHHLCNILQFISGTPPPPISVTISSTPSPHLTTILISLSIQHYYGPPRTSAIPAKGFPPF